MWCIKLDIYVCLSIIVSINYIFTINNCNCGESSSCPYFNIFVSLVIFIQIVIVLFTFSCDFYCPVSHDIIYLTISRKLVLLYYMRIIFWNDAENYFPVGLLLKCCMYQGSMLSFIELTIWIRGKANIHSLLMYFCSSRMLIPKSNGNVT
jgi:hypothetical protein